MNIILTSILPICFIMALGAALSAKKFLSASFFMQLNRLGFYILLPSLVGYKIAIADAHAIAPGLRIGVLLCVCSTIIIFIALTWAKLTKLSDSAGRALMQAAMRGNLAYSGLPIVLFTFGANSDAATLAVLSLIPAIPFYNFMAVIILTPPQGSSLKQRLKKTFLGVIKNPLIIGCAIGLLIMLFQLNIPAPIMRSVKTIGEAALPCALLSLGAGLSFKTIRTQIKPAIAATILKLIIMPLIGYLLLLNLTHTDEILLISIFFLACPTAVTSYVMAEQMGADKDLTAAAITLSTILAMPVMAVILLLFR